MAFAQLTWRESLRDIQTCLRAARQALPPRISIYRGAQYAVERQCGARLAHSVQRTRNRNTVSV